MTGSIFELTDEQKRAIRLLEVLAILHDIGKLSDEFLASVAKEENRKKYPYAYEVLVDPRAIFPQAPLEQMPDRFQDLWRNASDAAKNTPFEILADEFDISALLSRN